MARRAWGPLDEALELWARWLNDNRVSLPGGGVSTLALLIDTQGDFSFGGGGGRPAQMPDNCLESRIEDAVYHMSKAHPDRADVLRLEWCAGWNEVVRRRQMGGFCPVGVNPMDKALAMNRGLRWYYLRLAEARQTLSEKLGIKQ